MLDTLFVVCSDVLLFSSFRYLLLAIDVAILIKLKVHLNGLFLDIFLKPEITFWECRVSAGGTLIQLLLEEGDEPVDAVVKFSSRENTGGGGNY